MAIVANENSIIDCSKTQNASNTTSEIDMFCLGRTLLKIILIFNNTKQAAEEHTGVRQFDFSDSLKLLFFYYYYYLKLKQNYKLSKYEGSGSKKKNRFWKVLG